MPAIMGLLLDDDVAAAQTISFGTAPTLTVGGTATVSATATSGLAVSFSSNTPSTCTVAGSTVTGVAAGTCTIVADQSGNSSYSAAPQVTQNITVQAATATSQTISFGTAPTLTVGKTATVSATATSGLAVSFSSKTPSICTVSGSTVTGVAAGTCTIAADQSGNSSYSAAPQVAQSITVQAESASAPVCTLSANSASITEGGSSTLTATCNPPATSYIWTGGACAGSGSTCTVSPTATTTYTVQGANAGGTKPAASVTVTVVPIRPPVCTLTANPASVSAGGSSTLTATCIPTANSFTWTGGSCAGTTGSTCMVNPTATTTYTVKGSNAAGTGAVASATVSLSQPDTCSVAPVSRPAGSVVTGTNSNESFSSSAGNDRIDGGGGIDTVVFRCSRAYYTIAQTTTGWTVQSDAEGLDTLLNIERLQFADKTVALDTSGNAGMSYRIYKAAFARTPDSGGLKYWIGQMDKGMDLQEVSARFIDSNEFRSIYGTNPTDEEFVVRVYRNVLGREPEKAGYDWWVDQLKKKLRTRTKVLADFSESPENQGGVWTTIKDGIELPN